MCVVSFIGDSYGDSNSWPWKPGRPSPPPPQVPQPFRKDWNDFIDSIGQVAEIDSLKKRVADLEELIRKGKVFDAETGQPDCELESKKESLRKIAQELGVEITFPE
jgi:hypothetical protein